MSKKNEKLTWDHEFVKDWKMVPEYMIRPILGIGESYWRTWLSRNRVPYVTICGVRWFQRDSFTGWFALLAGSPSTDDDHADHPVVKEK